MVNIEQEKHSYKNMKRVMGLKNKDQILHNAFVLDTIEFLMILMVPTESKLALNSYADLLPKKEDGVTPSFEMPEWFLPLLKVSYFLHFFRDEMRLPTDIMKEIYSDLISGHIEGAMDNIIVVRKIPKKNETYTKVWIVEKLFEIL